MITADGDTPMVHGCGSGSWPSNIADETGLIIQVCHYPPGTSKWNKIDIACSATSRRTGARRHSSASLIVIELIANTTTKTGLRIRCELDSNIYPKGIKVSDAEMATLNMTRDLFHPEWNYSISPRFHEMKQ